MYSSALTSKGQVTIPIDYRKVLGLHPGDKVGFVMEGDHLVLFKKLNDIEASFGLCKPKTSVSLQKMEEVIRKKGCGDDKSQI